MLTFRNSKIIYYGPHECSNCGVLIAKMSEQFGATAFTYPRGPIYPNTEWHPHVCDSRDSAKISLAVVKAFVKKYYPLAQSIYSETQGWLIVSGDDILNLACTLAAPSFIASEIHAWNLVESSLNHLLALNSKKHQCIKSMY